MLRVAKAHATKRLLLGWSRNMLRFWEIQCSFWNKKAQDVLQENKQDGTNQKKKSIEPTWKSVGKNCCLRHLLGPDSYGKR